MALRRMDFSCYCMIRPRLLYTLLHRSINLGLTLCIRLKTPWLDLPCCTFAIFALEIVVDRIAFVDADVVAAGGGRCAGTYDSRNSSTSVTVLL